MRIGPKYKIARRLGPNIFEKTQSPKFARRAGGEKKFGGKGGKIGTSDFALQVLEKQKVRYTYGILERQFRKSVLDIIKSGGLSQNADLFKRLEKRLDNVVFRMGLASSRQASRQMVGHRHILVNNKTVNIPSFEVSVGDTISIREGSKKKKLFAGIEESLKDKIVPSWISLDKKKFSAEISSEPSAEDREIPFNLSLVLQFYKR